MSEKVKTFAVAPPNSFDGTVFEVADRSVKQAGAVAGVLRESLTGALPMIANAEMERQLYASGEADYKAFEGSALGKQFAVLIAQAEAIERKCAVLARAASFDPKHPPKE